MPATFTLSRADVKAARELERKSHRANYVRKLAAVLGSGQNWEYRGECIDLERCTGRCACGHEGLRFLFTIHHKHNGQRVVVGSTCIATYPGISPALADRLEQECERLEEIARRKSAGAKRSKQLGPMRLFEGLDVDQGPDTVLWGKHPSHGPEWLKLSFAGHGEREFARQQRERKAEGWELAIVPLGSHPDERGPQ